MKKHLALFLSGCLALSLLAGCGGQPGQKPAASGNAPANSGAGTSAGDGTVYVVRVGDTVQDDSIYATVFNDVFIPYIEEHGGGRIQIERYGNSTLGSDQQLAESLQVGTLEAAMIPMSCMGNFDPDFMALDLPFLYEDPETAYAALDGEWGQIFDEKMEALGIKRLGWEENGFRNFSSNTPIHTVADMSGLKMRVMESTIYVETMKCLGASPTPMAFSELYTALQNGTVAGQDNGPVLTYTSKFFEVQDYYTVSEYCYAASMFAVSKDWFEGLPTDVQEVLTGAALVFQDAERQALRDETETYISMLEENGMEIIRLTPEQKAEFQAACVPVYDIMKSYVDPEIIETAKTINDTY